MKQAACAQCGTSRPMGEMFTVFGRTLCEACGNAELAQRQARKEKVPDGAVARQVDPTVCAKCGQDYGSAALPLVGSIPLCDRCARGILRYPFPTWLKAALAAVVLLALLSFARNWRFMLLKSVG